MQAEKALVELVRRLEETYSRDLLSVVLYGSAAGNDFDEDHSDLNVLCVLRDVELASIEKLEKIANWWRSLGNAAPLLFAEGELERACDAFPMEFLDIRDQHRVLHGEDPTPMIHVDPELHRVQVEHEVRARLMALRQRYLGVHRDKSAVARLMVDSLPSLATLLRHALLVAGVSAPSTKREVIQAASERFKFDGGPFLTILGLREESEKRSAVDVRATFAGYYSGILRLCEQVDSLVRTKAGIS